MKKKTKIHNAGSLISPTTHLFPLSGQSRSHGVTIKVTLILQYGVYDKSNQSILFFRGDGEWARKSLFAEIFYYQWLKYQRTYMIPLGSYTELNQYLTKCQN